MNATMNITVNIDANGHNANLSDTAVAEAVADLLEGMDVVGGAVTINL